ncbi:MAG: hypothetical protein KF716_29455 [Anaerolineae bacterium]|nr:hypothetical protein [Anaerolineae bacterium]
MAISSWWAARRIGQRYAQSDATKVIRLRRPLLCINVAAWMLVSLMLIILGVMILASRRMPLELPDLPSEYLPGHSLPLIAKDATCIQSETHYVSCRTQLYGQEVNVFYDQSTRMIVRTGIKVDNHTIGEFVTAWGQPTGFDRQGNTIAIYWGTRTAILYVTSFHPTSRVALIRFDFEPQPASAWHGFASSENAEETS